LWLDARGTGTIWQASRVVHTGKRPDSSGVRKLQNDIELFLFLTPSMPKIWSRTSDYGLHFWDTLYYSTAL